MQGKQLLQSSLQTAACSALPNAASTTAGDSAARPYATAAPKTTVPTACITKCQKHLVASQCLPMQLLYGQTATPHVLDQPAPCIAAQDSLASKAQSQHSCLPNNADAASGVKHEAVSSAAPTTVNRLSNAKSTGITAGRLQTPPPTDQPAALLPPAALLRGVITAACKVQSTLTSPQLPPSAEAIPLTERQATEPQATELQATTLLCTEALATANIFTELPAAATRTTEPLFAEASVCGLSERCCSPCDTQEPFPPQPSSIFGSPQASMPEDCGQVTVGADSDSTTTSLESAQSLSWHQLSKADSCFEASEAAPATLCLVGLPSQVYVSTHEISSACAWHSTASPTNATSAVCIGHGVAVSGAQGGGPPSSSSVPAAKSGEELAASIGPGREGLPVNCPLPDASAASGVLLAPFASAIDVTSRLNAKCDMSWVAARTSASQGGESSSGRQVKCRKRTAVNKTDKHGYSV